MTESLNCSGCGLSLTDCKNFCGWNPVSPESLGLKPPYTVEMSRDLVTWEQIKEYDNQKDYAAPFESLGFARDRMIYAWSSMRLAHGHAVRIIDSTGKVVVCYPPRRYGMDTLLAHVCGVAHGEPYMCRFRRYMRWKENGEPDMYVDLQDMPLQRWGQ